MNSREYVRRNFAAWAVALGLLLAFVGLFVATGESLRRQEHRAPPIGAVAPAPGSQEFTADEAHRRAGTAAWEVP